MSDIERARLDQSGKIFNIPELGAGVNVVLGTGEPLRSSGTMNGFDILKLAKREKIPVLGVLNLLARQLHIYRSVLDEADLYTPQLQDYRDSLRIFLGQSNLPFLVGQTTQAIIKEGVSNNVDPRTFQKNYLKYQPDDSELISYGFTGQNVNEAFTDPAVFAGAAVVIYWDGIDENVTWLRRQTESQLYPERWSIPGGHADTFYEVPALEELHEETLIDHDITGQACPLAAVDQVLFKSHPQGSVKLIHYLNLVWEVPISSSPLTFKDGDGHGVWRSFGDEEVADLEKQGLLTPIAGIALRQAGFL